MRAGVQPSEASAHDLYIQLALLQVAFVHIVDFQLTSVRRLDIGPDVAHLLIIKIQAGDRVIALGCGGLFFNAQRTLLVIKIDHAVALRVVHIVCKDTRPGITRIGTSRQIYQVVAVINVIAQHQCTRVVAHKVFAVDKHLRQTLWARLHRILDDHAPLAAVAQQLAKARRVFRRADQQHIANARQH